MKSKKTRLAIALCIITLFVLIIIPSKTASGLNGKGKSYFAGDGSFYCDCTKDKSLCSCPDPEPIK